MSRDTTFLLALGMFTAAAFAVGVSGWVLFVRDRHLGASRLGHGAAPSASAAPHHEADGEE